MRYFKSKLSAISREYTKRDREAIIASVGNKCPMCDRKNGDIFLFGPTNYLKQQIKFKVRMDIHVISNSSMGQRLVVICNGCHLSYHLFNRLSEGADMGGRRLSDTLYKRCANCKELSCMCCESCGKLPKWCACKSSSNGAPSRKRKQERKSCQSGPGRLRLRSAKKSKARERK
jgi:hypothetical protein